VHYTLTARLAIAISGWLLARAGVEWHVGQAAGPVVHNLRDKRGRFRPKDGGGYGLPKSIPHHVTDLMHDLGITQKLYESAAVPLVLPDDLEDIPALEVCLRMWILRNLDHWVHGKGRNPYTMIQALMCTWAIDMYKWKPPKRMLRRFTQLADESVGEDMQAAAVDHRSERFQRVADIEQSATCDHGARAFRPHLTGIQSACSSAEPPSLSTSDSPTLRLSDLSPSDIELDPNKRAERPHSVPLGINELDSHKREERPRSVPIGDPCATFTTSPYAARGPNPETGIPTHQGPPRPPPQQSPAH
jgi:hypothetical protein